MFPQVLFHLTASSQKMSIGRKPLCLVSVHARAHTSQEGAHVDDRMHVFQMSYDLFFVP